MDCILQTIGRPSWGRHRRAALRSVRRLTIVFLPDVSRGDFPIESIPEAVFFNFQVVARLEVQPKPLRSSKKTRQSECRICANRALAANDLINATWWNAYVFRQPILTDS